MVDAMTQHIAKALVTSANLKQQIRTACHPDDPQLLKRYINLALDSANTAGASSEKIRILLDCAALLLETACDQKVVLSWRYQCLDQIYRPLLAAEKQSITAGDHHRVRQFSHLFTHLTPTFFN